MIRITGMNSGLDTEAIINELASARSVKVTSLQKAQTKLSWKIDAWQSLNTKIHTFYTDFLSDMRFEGSYSKKTAKVSHPNAVSVITGQTAMNGTQQLNIGQLAQTGYLTGAKVKKSGTFGGGDANADTAFRVLGIEGEVKFKLKVNGEEKELTFNSDTKMKDVVSSLREAGLNANFDETNSRFFVSSAKSGKDNDFELTGADTNSVLALSMLGLNTQGLTQPNKANMEKEALDKYTNSYNDLVKKLADPDLEHNDRVQLEFELSNVRRMVEVDGDGKVTGLSQQAKDEVSEEYTRLDNLYNDLSGSGITDNLATKTEGKDAVVWLNGVQFTFDSNTFEINGLTYTVNQVTDPIDPEKDLKDATFSTSNSVTITTETDTSGVYDMIKDFLKQYNDLIKEMDTLYNADSAKKYEPLTTEEKDALSDKEVEEWEKKIKDSLLRRDSTLGTVANAMKEIMLGGYSVTNKNGETKTMYLSNFGIETLSYFLSGDNEKGVFHIDGDEDDVHTKAEVDKLRTAIANDPDMVTDFFMKLGNTLYDKLTDLMGRTDYSSAYKVYNDKQMDIELKSYDTKIKEAQDKLNDYMDKWYSKFSKMEVAMSKLESKTNAITNMLG